jgi:hypothetical protein
MLSLVSSKGRMYCGIASELQLAKLEQFMKGEGRRRAAHISLGEAAALIGDKESRTF